MPVKAEIHPTTMTHKTPLLTVTISKTMLQNINRLLYGGSFEYLRVIFE